MGNAIELLCWKPSSPVKNTLMAGTTRPSSLSSPLLTKGATSWQSNYRLSYIGNTVVWQCFLCLFPLFQPSATLVNYPRRVSTFFTTLSTWPSPFPSPPRLIHCRFVSVSHEAPLTLGGLFGMQPDFLRLSAHTHPVLICSVTASRSKPSLLFPRRAGDRLPICDPYLSVWRGQFISEALSIIACFFLRAKKVVVSPLLLLASSAPAPVKTRSQSLTELQYLVLPRL